MGCKVSASGVVVMTTLRPSGPVTRQRQIGSATASLAAGQWGGLSLPVGLGVRRAVLRALRSGGAANAQLNVIAADENGLKTRRTRYIRLVGPRRPHRHHHRHR